MKSNAEATRSLAQSTKMAVIDRQPPGSKHQNSLDLQAISADCKLVTARSRALFISQGLLGLSQENESPAAKQHNRRQKLAQSDRNWSRRPLP